jgi:predicted metal-dependent HD superfamily phosphohydrolase
MSALSAPEGLDLPREIWNEIFAAYSSPGRAYHNADHLRAVVDWFHVVAREVGWQRPREVFFALLFHDAVYVPGAKDNETESAKLAERDIAKWLPAGSIDGSRVRRLIELTARHGSLGATELDRDEALFLDCDMSILGAPAPAYDAYERGVAEEYAAVPPDLYRMGRRKFLEQVLSLETIFFSPYFRDRLEARAHENLRRALALL